MDSGVNTFTNHGTMAARLCFCIRLLLKYFKGNFYCIKKCEIGETYRMQWGRGNNKCRQNFRKNCDEGTQAIQRLFWNTEINCYTEKIKGPLTNLIQKLAV